MANSNPKNLKLIKNILIAEKKNYMLGIITQTLRKNLKIKKLLRKQNKFNKKRTQQQKIKPSPFN